MEQTELDEHKSLYGYALLAGVPSDQAGHSCTVSGSTVLDLDLAGFETIDPEVVRRLDFPKQLFYNDKNDNLYVACRSEGAQYYVFFRITWRLLPNGNNDGISLVAALHLLYGGAPHLFSDEHLEFAALSRHEESENGPEDLIAIRGMNTEDHRQRLVGINDVLSKSCGYEFMVDFVSRLARHNNADSLTVVGHSLGGTATHYIARDSNVNVAAFRAYSYGALGVKVDPASMASRRSVWSYYLEGDVVAEILGPVLGRQQLGRAIRYVPRDSSWRSDGTTRHELKTIQKALCECMRGRGAFIELGPDNR